LPLDASRPDKWPLDCADAIVNINMIHIAPWAATQGLMKGAGRLLDIDGILFPYGPYIESEIDTAPSNLAFDRDLKTRNPAWGLRHRDEIMALATLFRKFKLPPSRLCPNPARSGLPSQA